MFDHFFLNDNRSSMSSDSSPFILFISKWSKYINLKKYIFMRKIIENKCNPESFNNFKDLHHLQQIPNLLIQSCLFRYWATASQLKDFLITRRYLMTWTIFSMRLLFSLHNSIIKFWHNLLNVICTLNRFGIQ